MWSLFVAGTKYFILNDNITHKAFIISVKIMDDISQTHISIYNAFNFVTVLYTPPIFDLSGKCVKVISSKIWFRATERQRGEL